MATVCQGCGLRVDPITVFEHTPGKKQWWHITRCPRERCKFNQDIESCPKPNTDCRKDKCIGGRSIWKGDHWG